MAGVPLWLTTDSDSDSDSDNNGNDKNRIRNDDNGINIKKPMIYWGIPALTRLHVSITSEIIQWQTPSLQAFREVFEMLDGFGVDAKRLRWVGGGFVAEAVEEPGEWWRNRWPSRVNGVSIAYVFGGRKGSGDGGGERGGVVRGGDRVELRDCLMVCVERVDSRTRF